MINNVVVEGDADSDDVAVVTDRDGQRLPISFQAIQGIYHQLTGKKEQLSVSSNDPFIVAFNDIEQLYLKISQCLEQYAVKTTSESVTVYFVDDNSESFSSFERFKVFNKGTNRLTESIVLRFDFAIVPSKSQELQSYKVVIRLASRIAIQQKIRNGEPGLPPRFLRLLGSGIFNATIVYVDYTVARTVKSAIDEWFGSLRKNSLNPFVAIVQRYSHFIPRIAHGIVMLASVCIVYFALPTLIKPSVIDFVRLLQVALVGMASIAIAIYVARFLGGIAEDKIDDYDPPSYICLTTLDENTAARQAERNKFSLILALFSGAASGFAAYVTKLMLGVL